MGLIRLEFDDSWNRIACMRPILDVASVGHKPKLLDQVRNIIRRKHYSIRTEQAYVDWIKRFIIYHNKCHPAEMAEEEVAQFLRACGAENDLATIAMTSPQAGGQRFIAVSEFMWMSDISQTLRAQRSGRCTKRG